MNIIDVERFCRFVESKGLGIQCRLGLTCTCRVFVKGNEGVFAEHTAGHWIDAAQGAVDGLSKWEKPPVEVIWYWRALSVREQIERREKSSLRMDFWMTFELVRLEKMGLFELGSFIADMLKEKLPISLFEVTKKELDELCRQGYLEDFVNNLDGLLVSLGDCGGIRKRFSDSIGHELYIDLCNKKP